MKACLVINPKSGPRSNLKKLEEAYDLLEKNGFSLTKKIVEGPNDARKFAEKAVEEKFDIVIAIGGDGTVGGVINGLANTDVKLGIIPTGTANVFANEIGIPSWNALKSDAFIKAAEIIVQGKSQKIDLGKINFEDKSERYFVMWCGIGLDAAITATKGSPPSGFLGRMTNYAKWSYSAFNISIKFSPTDSVIKYNDGNINEKINSVIVSNGKLYANYFKTSKDAKLTDGLLDVIIVKGKVYPSVIKKAFISVARKRLYSDAEEIQTKHISISTNIPLPVHADAETVGLTPVEIEIVPKGLNVIVPKEI